MSLLKYTDAFSAKNVRIHGMSSNKWTTKDKITQFKGLVNLYKRDHQITKADATVANKQHQKSLVSLQKTIEKERNELENALTGEIQKFRNIFADYKDMQLAYQHSRPKQVIENITHVNFTHRKHLDRLGHQMKLKSQKLKRLKLEDAVLEDRLKLTTFGQIEEEKLAQITEGKVQDALLKKEAALAIQQSYVEIINVMKKDALYFERILQTIGEDHYLQSKCVLEAARQGQLATEYNNDRQVEYEELEKAVIKDMKTQKVDLELVKEQTANLKANLKSLLRKDSDITTCLVKAEVSTDTIRLRKDVARIETTLLFLKNSTSVSCSEKIYPNLQEQLRQAKRLETLAQKCERHKNDMLNKLNHAVCMKDLIKNTMLDTTAEYKKLKKELLTSIEETKSNKCNIERKLKSKINMAAQVSTCLKHLQQMCRTIKIANKKDKLKIDNHLLDDVPIEPESFDVDRLAIISWLKERLEILLRHLPDKDDLDGNKLDTAFDYYEALMVERGFPPEQQKATNNSQEDEFITESSNILTREDIKRQSADIVAANTEIEEFSVLCSKKNR